MSGERFGQVVRSLAINGIGLRPLGEVIGDTCAAMLGTPHCGLLVLDADDALAVVGSSTPLMSTLEDLELTLGVGPCQTASRLGQPVAEPDLAAADPGRWLGFCSAALAAGTRSAFAFPLLAATGSIGSLNVARERPGPLTTEQHEDGETLTGIVAHFLLSQSAGGSDEAVAELVQHQAVVHQATGMVGAQLAVSMTVALAVLRARAFSSGRFLAAVADDVVHRRLRFE